MENIIVSKDFLEKIRNEFDNYTILDFEKSKEIDIESFLFFKKILFENKAQIYLDISEEDILRFKSDDVIDKEYENIAAIIRSLNHIFWKSKKAVYDSLRSGKFDDVLQNDLPCFLLLDNVSKEICVSIEKAVGINCYSLKRLKVEKKIRAASLDNIANTRQALFDKINQFNYHTILLHDSYFSKNMNSIKSSTCNNNQFFKMLKFNTHSKLTLQINTDPSNIINQSQPEIEFVKRKKIFEADLQTYCEKSNLSVSCEFTDKGKHDRYINTNIMINILGNSLFSSSTTHLNCYPKILYGDYKFEKETT